MNWEHSLRRLPRPNQVALDMLIALLLTGVSFLATLYFDQANPVFHSRPLDPLGAVLLALQSMPLAVRQRYPMHVWATTGTTITIYSILGYPPGAGGLGVLLALYTVAAKTDRRSAIAAAVVTTMGIAVSIVGAYANTTLPADVFVLDLISNYVVFATAWIFGDNVRVRRAYTTALEARAALLEREREENARLAVAEERGRIARELHDVVAHHVSVMVVQAEAARRVLAAEPELAADALESVQGTGREALAEMRRMLGVLREVDSPDNRRPQPSLERLDALIETVREAGLAVELEIEGTPRPIPVGIDLSAYRIVQEALTNTIKHGGKASARVRLRYGERELELEVVDNGRGAAAGLVAQDGTGHGLIGMRERVALFGGELMAGPRIQGGYAVRARLPL